MASKLGTNIKITDKDDRIIITISKEHKPTKSNTGRSKLLASSGGFATMPEIEGFEDKDLGLNLILSIRDKKAKTKKKRDDDDDED